MFKIGNQLTLEQIVDNHTEEFNCVIMDYQDNHVIVDHPIHATRNKFFNSVVNTVYKAKYINEDGQLFLFDVTVEGRKVDQIPLIILGHQGIKSFVKIEQRKFLRVDTKLDVAIHSVQGEFPPFTTMTKDISAGGAAIYTPKEIFLDKGMDIDCWFVLAMQSGQLQYIKLRSEIVMTREYNKKLSLIAVRFTHTKEQEKQLLVRYCFERQLILKKKLH